MSGTTPGRTREEVRPPSDNDASHEWYFEAVDLAEAVLNHFEYGTEPIWEMEVVSTIRHLAQAFETVGHRPPSLRELAGLAGSRQMVETTIERIEQQAHSASAKEHARRLRWWLDGWKAGSVQEGLHERVGRLLLEHRVHVDALEWETPIRRYAPGTAAEEAARQRAERPYWQRAGRPRPPCYDALDAQITDQQIVALLTRTTHMLKVGAHDADRREGHPAAARLVRRLVTQVERTITKVNGLGMRKTVAPKTKDTVKPE